MLQKYGPGEIQGVFTVNDEAALGAMQAIQAAGRGDEITIVGIDGNEDAANAIKAGTMYTTAADDPWMKGYEAVYQLVYKLQNDSKFEVMPVIPVTYVTTENVDKYLENFAYWAQFYKP
jgi:ribose transport system substrate-binding protein